MLRIVCVEAGNYQGRGRDYVEILRDMVRRNLAEGMAGEFICFTDDRSRHPSVDCRLLPTGPKGWWNKLALFQPGLFETGDRIVYFDLDVVIAGRLDEIVRYDGEFAILRDFFAGQNGIYGSVNSSVMAWRAGFGGYLWAEYVRAGYPDLAGGDQVWIERRVKGPGILQDNFPGLFASYQALAGKVPVDANVVCFHGHPKPHEMIVGWAPEIWKVGGLTRADLDRVLNMNISSALDNVRSSLERDLPTLDQLPPHDGHVAIVGGGPSLAAQVEAINWRQSLGQKIWGLNGSARWLRHRGIAVDAQVICDGRRETADLVDPEAAHYYIASNCDPETFNRADATRTTLFHSALEGVQDILGDRYAHLIGGGSTVGLQAMCVAYLEGFRKLHLYGYDSSLAEEDRHHAYPQSLNDKDRIVEAMFGSRKFRCAPWMVQQAEEFMLVSRFLVDNDCLITVAGDGLLPTMARSVRGMPLTPAELRAQAIISRLPNNAPVRGAEIGVFAGALSSLLLTMRDDLTLIMVDAWEGDGASYLEDSGDFHAGLTQADQDNYESSARSAVAFAGDRAVIVKGRSTDVATRVVDHSLDFVFIDADHSYTGCMADISAWARKVRPGGLLSGHDYENPAGPKFGVAKAVDKYAADAGVAVERGENWTWFVRLPRLIGVAA